jgi:hypothetical protein
MKKGLARQFLQIGPIGLIRPIQPIEVGYQCERPEPSTSPTADGLSARLSSFLADSFSLRQSPRGWQVFQLRRTPTASGVAPGASLLVEPRLAHDVWLLGGFTVSYTDVSQNGLATETSNGFAALENTDQSTTSLLLSTGVRQAVVHLLSWFVLLGAGALLQHTHDVTTPTAGTWACPPASPSISGWSTTSIGGSPRRSCNCRTEPGASHRLLSGADPSTGTLAMLGMAGALKSPVLAGLILQGRR